MLIPFTDENVPFVRLMPGQRAPVSYFVKFDDGDMHEVSADGDLWLCHNVELTDFGFERTELCPGFKYRGKCRHVLFIQTFHLRAQPFVEQYAFVMPVFTHEAASF